MLRYAVIFLIIAAASAIVGFGGVAGGAADEMARILCYVFLLVTVVMFILGLLKH